MEQLVWAIVIIIFITFTILKNRARNKPDTEDKTEVKRDKLARYMEKLLGIETPETKPEIRTDRIDEERYELLEEVRPKPEPIIEKKVGQFESPLTKRYKSKSKPPISEKKDIYRSRLPWGTLSRKDLKNAIIFAEILGPPICKRKGHRLF
ncbi:MAG: hypothetical protein ACUZ8N_00185 [Candidatus Scalindua sp.]